VKLDGKEKTYLLMQESSSTRILLYYSSMQAVFANAIFFLGDSEPNCFFNELCTFLRLLLQNKHDYYE